MCWSITYCSCLQTCIGFVLDAIEEKATTGFRCMIGTETMHLFPRVGAMSLDTLERVKYFALKSVRACGICRLRSGRSVTRVVTRHNPGEIEDLYTVVNSDTRGQPAIRARKREREKLHRHGFNPQKKCRLHRYVRNSLVNVCDYGPKVYAGLIRYERMHIYFINYCTYCMDLLLQCVDSSRYDDVQRSL